MKRFSQKREDIKRYLETHAGAFSATTLHSALPHIDLTTIYRNLEHFVTDGSIKKVVIGNEFLYEYQPHPHHHAICDECQKIVHFTAPDEKIASLLGLKDFTVRQIEVTVHGQCNHRLS